MNKRRRYQQKRNARLFRVLPEKVNDHIDRMTDKEIRMWLRRPKKFKTRKHQTFHKTIRKAIQEQRPINEKPHSAYVGDGQQISWGW